MTWAERIKSLVEGVQSTADAIGKTLWVFFAVFAAVAIGTGHPNLLGAIRDRLVLAGVTSLKTPFGDIKVEQIGRLDASFRNLGINAARASELADRAQDGETKKQLEQMAKELRAQQQLQFEALSNVATEQKANSSTSPPADGGDMEGWLYLGRRSGDKWRPPSFSIREPAYPVKSGDKLEVTGDALMYGAIDCKVIDASDFQTSKMPQSFVLVKPGPSGIQVTDDPTECSSTGGAKTVWAKVKVPAKSIVRVTQ